MALRRRFRRRYKPYSRRPYNGYRRFKRSGAPRRTGGYFGTRRQMLRVERKTIDWFNVANTATAVALNNAVTAPILLNGCATGTDFTERIGRKIQMKSIQMIINVTLDPDTTDIAHTSFARFICVFDKQWNGGTLSTSDLVNVLARSDTTTSLPTTSPINLNNRDRYKIIFDKRCHVDMGKQSCLIKIYKKLNLETIYGGTTAAASSIQTGALLFFYIGTHDAGNDAAEFQFYNRVRFVDI